MGGRRIGERKAMIYAALISVLGLIAAILAPAPWMLGIAMFLVGLSTAVFALARHAFITSFVPVAYRARALSTLGGTFRLGFFIGPLISAAVIHVTGTTQSVFLVFIVGCLGAAGLLLVLRDPTETLTARRTAGEALVEQESLGLFRSIWASRQVLARLALHGRRRQRCGPTRHQRRHGGHLDRVRERGHGRAGAHRRRHPVALRAALLACCV